MTINSFTMGRDSSRNDLDRARNLAKTGNAQAIEVARALVAALEAGSEATADGRYLTEKLARFADYDRVVLEAQATRSQLSELMHFGIDPQMEECRLVDEAYQNLCYALPA